MNITNIPAPRVDFIDPRTGLMAREWYRFFLNLFLLVGEGTNSTSLTDLQVLPDIPDVSSLVTEAIQQGQLSAPVNHNQQQADKYNRVMAWLSIHT